MPPQNPHFTKRSRVHPARSGSLSVAMWAFGLATSLFLIGMWGRTVAVDTATIEESTRVIIDADVAKERINTWLEDGLTVASATDSETVHAVAEGIQDSPEYTAAVDAIIGQFIEGLFASDGSDPVLDIDQTVAPLVPVVISEFAERDVAVDTDRIEGVLDAAGTIELDTGEAATVAAVIHDARVLLTQVVFVALIAMVLTGAIAMSLVDKRFLMLRTLATRVGLAAVSYALILRIASWALDPARGRSPIAGGGSVLLGSNGQVLLLLAGAASVVAGFGGWVAWKRKRLFVPIEEGDDTRELVAV
ncbi:MAG: LPXTG cell wall anchor domain-containing protein [Actinomycetia bacterium]|nr:LPXTG cell wall anchor domain-containing protein [Actinomycetes bacterium]